MRRWCRLSDEEPIQSGSFTEAHLRTHSGQPIHGEAQLITELARLSMLRYESQPTATFLVVDDRGEFLDRPEKTKKFYRRLFDSDGGPTQDSITWVSETLALWMETSFEPVLFAEAGRPHDTDPAYDIISLIGGGSDEAQMRLVQVKATENRLQDNRSQALRRFGQLENGGYDPELLHRLCLLEELGRLPEGLQPRELLYDRERRYRVTGIHSQDRNNLTILTTYAQVITGGIWRRSARLVHLSDWQAFWSAVSEVVYAQLT